MIIFSPVIHATQKDGIVRRNLKGAEEQMDTILYCTLLPLVRNNAATLLVKILWYKSHLLLINKSVKGGKQQVFLQKNNIIQEIILITANEAATVAYAAHCQQEKAFDRPIAGHTNICPDAIVDGQKEISMLISTVKHELLHALGFSLRYSIV